MSRETLVNLNTAKKLNEFSKIVSNFKSDINIYSGAAYYDAKSIMALLSLDRSKPKKIEIISNDEEEIKRFHENMEVFK